MTVRSISVAAVAAAILASNAHAQQQPPAAPMPPIPPSTCVKPELPGKLADSRGFDRFNREYKAYGACVNKYIDDTNALATAALAAGKSALDQLNALNDEIKERQEQKGAK